MAHCHVPAALIMATNALQMEGSLRVVPPKVMDTARYSGHVEVVEEVDLKVEPLLVALPAHEHDVLQCSVRTEPDDITIVR